MHEFIDISLYNEIKDWKRVRQQKLGALIKSSQNTYKDPVFDKHWAASGEAGMARSLWHFYQPNQPPAQQVNAFMNIWNGLTWKPGISWIDVENISYKNISTGQWVSIMPPSREKYTYWIDEYIKAVSDKTGCPVGIYTRASFWNDWIYPAGWGYYTEGWHTAPDWSKLPLWVANYFVNSPALPKGWAKWDFWQYSGDRALLDGIVGNIDLDYSSWHIADIRKLMGGFDVAPVVVVPLPYTVNLPVVVVSPPSDVAAPTPIVPPAAAVVSKPPVVVAPTPQGWQASIDAWARTQGYAGPGPT